MLKIIALIVLISVIGYAFINFNNQPPTTNSVTPTAVPTLSMSTAESIKNLLVKKYNWELSKIVLSVKSDLGDYASGGVNYGDEAGGGLWFAAKVDGLWQLVFDGNGIITCTKLSSYPQYPSSLIPECFDDKTNKLVKR